MIDHHAMAVMMAQTCLTNAVRPELRTMCEQIFAAQSAEIQTMQTWLQQWYGVAHAPDSSPGMMKMNERLAALTGAEFEIAFMRMMIRHHYRAVVEGVRCMDGAYHPELLQMCADIVITQATEIRTLQTWLCAWYGLCNVGPRAPDAS